MSEALPSVPRKRRKSARPGEIVEAATQSFIEHGYAGTKLDDVARRAGIAKARFISILQPNRICLRQSAAVFSMPERPSSSPASSCAVGS